MNSSQFPERKNPKPCAINLQLQIGYKMRHATIWRRVLNRENTEESNLLESIASTFRHGLHTSIRVDEYVLDLAQDIDGSRFDILMNIKMASVDDLYL